MARIVTAQFDSDCAAECGDQIVADVDQITYSDEHGGFVHEDCA